MSLTFTEIIVIHILLISFYGAVQMFFNILLAFPSVKWGNASSCWLCSSVGIGIGNWSQFAKRHASSSLRKCYGKAVE